MCLFFLALVQAASAPVPATAPAPASAPASVYVAVDLPGGGFSYTVARIPAATLAEIESDLDNAAAKRCGRMAIDADEQSYDQAVDKDGNPAAEITNLHQTYKCTLAAAPAAP